MDDDKIILADETEFPCVFCGVAHTGTLYMDLLDITLAEAITVFSDTAKTSSMVCHSYSSDRALNGYTYLIGVERTDNGNNATRVIMRKPFADEVTDE